jgi:glycosyltransferase involved in cell wall biosynthesis
LDAHVRTADLRSLALIEPLGDAGIGTYTHELAEALVGAGIRADVYATESAWSRSLPRRHRLYPVIGSALFHQRDILDGPGRALADPPQAPAVGSAGAMPDSPSLLGEARSAARSAFLTFELALWLRRRGYDAVWTQWPEIGARFPHFWRSCRRLGLRLIHTVHNVLPHERGAGDERRYRAVYDASDVLLVHSRAAEASLESAFPDAAAKSLVSWHGTYTTYPRAPEARARLRAQLGVGDATPLVLFFGGVRPYKNVDAVLHALRGAPDLDLALLVAGVESGYSGPREADKLARTRRLATELGVDARVRFLPGPFSFAGTAEIFEAADLVVLPYLESFGSGQLLLAMTFGRWIAATAVGGMDEYLNAYPRGFILRDLAPAPLANALRGLAHAIRAQGDRAFAWDGGHFSWREIVAALLPRLRAQLSPSTSA